ncbi:hypothetical protein [Thermococcus sp.]
MKDFTWDNFMFTILLLLPLALLLFEALLNAYCWSYCGILKPSLFIQLSLALLWSVEVWWVLSTKKLPTPVLVSSFFVFYLAYVVDNPPKLSTYLSNILWAMLYTYALKKNIPCLEDSREVENDDG